MSILYKFIHPNKDTVFLIPSNGCWLMINFSAGYRQYFPHPRGIFRISERSNQKVVDKYTKESIVQVEKNDIVVDIGAFVGEFSLGVSHKAKKVIACEPSPLSVHSLQQNIQNNPNIEAVSTLVGAENRIETLSFGSDPTDNSIINIDSTSEETSMSLKVPSIQLKNLVDNLDIEKIDFLKVEAEGAEPEVLAGINEIPIKKIAVDAGPERYGEKTTNLVNTILNEAGYQTYTDRNVVYGINNANLEK